VTKLVFAWQLMRLSHVGWHMRAIMLLWQSAVSPQLENVFLRRRDEPA
jgi:hypothetical protein